jgi:hypothetical protein
MGIMAALLASPALAQEKAAKLAPLVQLQGVESLCERAGIFGFGGRYCIQSTSRERSITVFRSGRVLSILTGVKQASSDPFTATYTPIPSTVRDENASKREITDLITLLNAQSIANGGGPCNPLPPIPPGSITAPPRIFRYNIVWFPADNSLRSYIAIDSDSTRACQPRIQAIFDAIVDFAAGE